MKLFVYFPLVSLPTVSCSPGRDSTEGEGASHTFQSPPLNQYSGHFLRQRLKPAFHRWYLPQ